MISANASAITDVTYKCQACNKSFKSIEKLDEHKSSKKHKKNEKEFLADKLVNSNKDNQVFTSINHDKNKSIVS